MINSPMDTADIRLLLPETIWLADEDFERAVEISNPVNGETHQWQTYLHVLGLLGFEQWLRIRVTDIPINREKCSILQPKYPHLLAAACNFKLGEFNLCLIATESLLDEVVHIPRAAIDLPSFAAHFYVLLEVNEEQEQVIIRGVLRHDQLVKYRQSVNLQPEPNWSYVLPLSLFEIEPNRLLHYSRFLVPTAIPLPVASANHRAKPSLTRAQVETLLSSLQSPDQPLWQSLTWEEGAIILQNPELLDILYQWQTQTERPISLSIRLREVLAILTQPAINAARWLQGELDEVAQSWELFVPEIPSLALYRSIDSIDQFEAAIAQLRAELDIPLAVHPTYQDIQLNEIPIRLCALSWVVESQRPVSPVTSDNSQKWSFMLILGTQSGMVLPCGIKLQVSNLRGILEESLLEMADPFLYVPPVEGDWGETLVVTIVSPEGITLTLPPYTFQPLQ